MSIHNAGSVFLNEQGINILVKHMMKQRPSLFNFGTARLNANRDLLCFQLDPDLDSSQPWITCIEPIVFNNYGIDICYQISNLEFDFHPTDVEPTNINQFYIKVTVNVGIGLPDFTMLEPYIKKILNFEQQRDSSGKIIVELIEVNQLECFQLDLKVKGHFEIEKLKDKKDNTKMVDCIVPKIESLDLVNMNIEPKTIDKTIDLFIFMALSTVRVEVEKIIKGNDMKPFFRLYAPSNPKIVDNELQLFLDAEIL